MLGYCFCSIGETGKPVTSAGTEIRETRNGYTRNIGRHEVTSNNNRLLVPQGMPWHRLCSRRGSRGSGYVP